MAAHDAPSERHVPAGTPCPIRPEPSFTPQMPAPEVSVIVPVYNEEAGLPALFARLYPALDGLATRYEVVFVNDGSRDRSAALLREQWEKRPETTRVILLAAKIGRAHV